MAEVILGTGQQKTVRRLLSVLEGQLRMTEGIPRKVTARADTAEVVAERPDFDSDFQYFELRVKVTDSALDTLRSTAAEYPKACSLTEDGDWQVVVCPPDGAVETGRVEEAVDKLSACIKLPEVWRVQGEKYRIDRISAMMLFQGMIQYKASDVHLSPGTTAIFRIDNDVHHSDLLGTVSAVQILGLIRELATDDNWHEFEQIKQTSFSFHEIGMGYARVSAFMKTGVPHITLRFLPEKIPSFEDLTIPRDTMEQLANLHRGLVLVTGMTGSGKTTTAAALVDWINANKSLHILCIENPIEYVHHNRKSVISQRNLGTDVNTFAEAVAGALRHDPDVIVIGEMRDPDTIRSAINAASTGHLVISTLHSNTASEVVNRIISFFDPVERDLVRLQLRDCLQCVICQRLVPKKGGGRMPALEMMFNDIKPINDAIIAGDTDAMRIGIQQSVGHSFLFETYLHRLERAGKIDVKTAREQSTDESIYEQMHMGTYSIPRLEHLKSARDASQRG